MGQHVTSDGRRRQVDAGSWQPSTEKAPAVHAKRWSWTASCSASLTAAGMGCKRSALSSARECHSCESVQSLGREGGGRENHGVCLKRLEVGRPSIIITHSLTHSSTASSSGVMITVLLRRAHLPQAYRFEQSWGYSRLGFGMRFRCGSCSKQCNSATVRGWLCVQAWYCSGTVVGPRWYPSRCRNLVSHLDCPWPCSAGRQKVEWRGVEGSGVE